MSGGLWPGIVASSAAGLPMVGGDVIQVGSYTYHKFTTSGSLVVSAAKTVDWLVVGGGGGRGNYISGGGGGAGGYRSGTGMALSPGTYTVVVGSGGAQSAAGGNTTFNGITSIGGGRGASNTVASSVGGSGGGGTFADFAGGIPPGYGLSAGTSGQGYSGAPGNYNYYSAWATYRSAGGGGGGANGNGGSPLAWNSSAGRYDDVGAGGAGATWLDGITYARGGSGGNTQSGPIESLSAAPTPGTGGGVMYFGGWLYTGTSGIVAVRYLT